MRLNPNTGRYVNNPGFCAGVAGGLASMGFTGIFLGVLWRGDSKKHKAAKNAPHDPPNTNGPTPEPIV